MLTSCLHGHSSRCNQSEWGSGWWQQKLTDGFLSGLEPDDVRLALTLARVVSSFSASTEALQGECWKVKVDGWRSWRGIKGEFHKMNIRLINVNVTIIIPWWIWSRVEIITYNPFTINYSSILNNYGFNYNKNSLNIINYDWIIINYNSTAHNTLHNKL